MQVHSRQRVDSHLKRVDPHLKKNFVSFHLQILFLNIFSCFFKDEIKHKNPLQRRRGSESWQQWIYNTEMCQSRVCQSLFTPSCVTLDTTLYCFIVQYTIKWTWTHNHHGNTRRYSDVTTTLQRRRYNTGHFNTGRYNADITTPLKRRYNDDVTTPTLHALARSFCLSSYWTRMHAPLKTIGGIWLIISSLGQCMSAYSTFLYPLIHCWCNHGCPTSGNLL